MITWTVYGDEPPNWHRAEWVTLRPGLRAIRYETDYDVSILFHNLAVVGGLERMRRSVGIWESNTEGTAAP